MAVGRIVALERRTPDRFDAVLYYVIPVNVRATYGVSGAPVVDSPSADLPVGGAEGLTAAEKAALDAGEALFRVWSMSGCKGLNPAQLLARFRQVHAEAASRILAKYTARYEHIGSAWDSEV